MKNVIIAAAVAAALASPLAANAGVKAKWFGFTQITAQAGGGGSADGLKFGADRVRIGYKLKDGNVSAKLQIDFNKADSSGTSKTKIGIPEIIKDAIVAYKVNSSLKVSTGVFKTPLGMDFNTSGKKLDITKRGMEKKLVLERAMGAMLSGKLGGGLSYAAFYGNPAKRSSAGLGGTTGKDNSWAVRIAYDLGKSLHLEASTGASEDSAAGKKDYDVWDVATKWKNGPMTVKFEYIDATNVKNTAGNEETVWFLHGGYQLNRVVELVARYYHGKAGSAEMSNTYLGVNLFLGSNKTNGRLQVNYVLADGDLSGTGAYSGKSKGYTDDTMLLQYQASF